MIPWLQMCKQHGLIDKIEGLEIPFPDKPIGYLDDVVPVSAEFLHMLITLIASGEASWAMRLPTAPAMPPTACLAARVSRCSIASTLAMPARPNTG